MRVLMIDAAPSPHSATFVAATEIQSQLKQAGIDCELYFMGNQTVVACDFCAACKQTGRCVKNDCLNPILALAEQADGYIFLSQSHYGAVSGALML